MNDNNKMDRGKEHAGPKKMTPRQKQKRNRKASSQKHNWRNRRKHWRKPVRKQVEMHRKTVLPSQERMEPEPVEKPKRVALVQERQGLQAKMLQQPETQMNPEIMATRTATVRLTEVSRRQGQRAVHLP